MRALGTARSGSQEAMARRGQVWTHQKREKPVTAGMGDAVAPMLVGPV
jgi:hypothetical protein